nr:putative integron gene cassette protein [uncultured bacterium]CAS02790.1 putative integron gene cassette protein [uncultured bacterium]
MNFRSEYVASIRGQGYVFARQILPGHFDFPENPALSGIPIKPHLSQPRALLADGSPDLNVFTFHLAMHSDTAKLSVGQVVELSGERA